MAFFGLKYGQDFENLAAHPTKNSQEYPPGPRELFSQATSTTVNT